MLRGLMRLEERIVLDGSGEHDDGDSASDAPNRILVVDSSQAGADVISAAARDNVVVVEYDSRYDTMATLLDRIHDAGAGFDIKSIAFANHGLAAQLRLAADGTLNLSALADNPEMAAFWQGVTEVLSEDGRVDLLGCNFYEGENGRALLDALEALTGVNFAASDNATGNTEYGGDWLLESDGIQIDAEYFNADILDSFEHLFDMPATGYVADSPSEVYWGAGSKLFGDEGLRLEVDSFWGGEWLRLKLSLDSSIPGESLPDVLNMDELGSQFLAQFGGYFSQDGTDVYVDVMVSDPAGLAAVQDFLNNILVARDFSGEGTRTLHIESEGSICGSSTVTRSISISVFAKSPDNDDNGDDNGRVDDGGDEGGGDIVIDDGPGVMPGVAEITIETNDVVENIFRGSDADFEEWFSSEFLDLSGFEQLIEPLQGLSDHLESKLVSKVAVELTETRLVLSDLGRSIQLLLAGFSTVDKGLGGAIESEVTELARTGQSIIASAKDMIGAAGETVREWTGTPAEQRDGQLGDRMETFSENLSEVNANVDAFVRAVDAAIALLDAAGDEASLSPELFNDTIVEARQIAYAQLKELMERRDSVFYDLKARQLGLGEVTTLDQ